LFPLSHFFIFFSLCVERDAVIDGPQGLKSQSKTAALQLYLPIADIPVYPSIIFLILGALARGARDLVVPQAYRSSIVCRRISDGRRST